jgi:capsular exopolysaccharide synthesis family protein
MLGELPKIKNFSLKTSRRPALLISTSPNSFFAKVSRKMQWNFSLKNRNTKNKVVAVTSARPGEGKTTVAASLALSMQKAGQKVLLIDANQYRPAVLKSLALKKPEHSENRGLSNILRGDIDAKRLVLVDKRSGLHVIDAGARLPDPAVLFTDPIFAWALAEYRKQYQWIIIDCPAISAGPEASLISQQAGATLLVVDAAMTEKVRFMEAVQRLAQDGASGLCLVLNKLRLADMNIPTINTSQKLEISPASTERSRVVSLNFDDNKPGSSTATTSASDTKVNVDIEAEEILNMLTRLAKKKA